MVDDREIVNERHISCDGGGGALGHPKVYLHISEKENEVTCPYCGKVFLYQNEEAEEK